MTQVTNTGKFSLIFSKFKKINAHNLVIFLLLPIIPSVSMFMGSYIIGWHNFNRSRAFLSYDEALTLSFIIYFSLLSFIVIMSIFIAYITDKLTKPNGFLYCLNYCIYLSIPFSVLGISAMTPNIFILGLAFVAAVGISFYKLEASVDCFLGMDADKRTYFMTLISLFFTLLTGLFLTAFLNFWPEYFDFVTSFFYETTK